ncbi:MAG: DUF99 family protein [Candidatus Thermoplasmatota archaeon]|jgi:endonuclease V-like protein UPF0215 family|nr:DUF99 family protein [Candidatus Thermoplasmatota archaeon]MCL5963643.1 DUF99 family protein [Candidatus Thermoplasmatota archaeon]
MKSQIRVIAFDDGPFTFREKKDNVIAVICRLPAYIEGIDSFTVTVDGTDSTDYMIDVISNSKFKKSLNIIMINGIAFAGFNIVDMDRLYRMTSIPVITVTRKNPDIDLMISAIKKRFLDWEARASLIQNKKTYMIEHMNHKLWISCSGIEYDIARTIVINSIYYGNYPEALRIAHIIAGGVAKLH